MILIRPNRGRMKRASIVAAALFAVATAGCTQGDFGEVRPSLVRDDIHDWMSSAATKGTPSEFELTDDERYLRDLGYPLIEPPYDRRKWYSVLNEYGHNAASYRAGVGRVDYANNLLSSRYRSPAGRYGQLIEDARNDIVRMPPFFDIAMRVLDIDIKRQQALAHVSPSPPEHANAIRRIRENAAIVRWVLSSLEQRCAAYRFALERLVVMTPSPQAAEADILIRRCRSEVARYRIGPRPVGKTGRIAAIR